MHADGPNLNQGAESTLSWLISLLTVMKLERAVVLAEAAEALPAAASAERPT